MNIDSDNNVAQSYLLGQLGRDDDSYKGMGADLLEDAVELVKQANGIVGSTAMHSMTAISAVSIAASLKRIMRMDSVYSMGIRFEGVSNPDCGRASLLLK